MKKINKLLLVVILLGATLLLTSCGGNKNAKIKTPELLIIDETSGEFTADFSQSKNNKTINNIDAYFVLYNGELEKLTNLGTTENIKYTLADKTEVDYTDIDAHDINDAYKKVFTFTIPLGGEGKTTELVFTQYNSKLSDNAKSLLDGQVLGVTKNPISYDKKDRASSGVVLKETYEYKSTGFEFKEVTLVDGVLKTTLIEGYDIPTYYSSANDLLETVKKKTKYISYTKKSVKYNFELSDGTDYTHTQDIWLALATAPINKETASFWNWIFLQMPIAYLVSFLGSITGTSFAIAILLATIIVRTLAWPIYAKTNDMSMKMAVAQPDIDKLNRKYATRKDPESQQKMQMEMMQLYKKHKINMFGCLLPFLQMPIFYAMFQVTSRITLPGGQFSDNVANTKFFWTDLNGGGVVAKIIFTSLVGITMFALQKISQIKPSYAKTVANPAPAKAGQPNTENTMKIVSYVMIFMMIITAYVTPGLGLSYYWIIGNVYSIVQTLINRKISEKKHAKLEEEKLYGRSREIIDAEFKKKGDK